MLLCRKGTSEHDANVRLKLSNSVRGFYKLTKRNRFDGLRLKPGNPQSATAALHSMFDGFL